MTQTQIDWAARGITWSVEPVSKVYGENNQSDKRVLGDAQILVVNDLEKFRAEYGDACVLGVMDGTSIRVMSQDVNRSGLAKGLGVEEIRSRIDARLRGTRNRPVGGVVTKEVLVYLLPNGQKFEGTTLVEYQQQYLAALVDAGVDSAVARTLATQQSPAGLK